jgi:carbonic anhydrase/acetyltransferase-like protein (isoleucine patch superfamily)
MPIYPYGNHLPRLGAGVFLAPSAELAGEIEVGEDSSFWFHTAARGDVNWIRVGARTSVQDGTILHVTHERFPLAIGADVVIGHSCMLHGCTLEDACLIGIGARVLDGAVIESGAQVGAGAVVPPGMRVPSGQLALGVPAKLVRPLSDAEREGIREIARRYVRVKNEYLETMGRGY